MPFLITIERVLLSNVCGLVLLAILQRGHIVVILKIFEECSFGIIAYDIADLSDAFVGGTQQPACVIHTGH
jgi:hypothetical protein